MSMSVAIFAVCALSNRHAAADQVEVLASGDLALSTGPVIVDQGESVCANSG
jgi:hypothetical protein